MAGEGGVPPLVRVNQSRISAAAPETCGVAWEVPEDSE